eukprot:scaffold39665_cov15-Tisochrysis_lutea.AAC.1
MAPISPGTHTIEFLDSCNSYMREESEMACYDMPGKPVCKAGEEGWVLFGHACANLKNGVHQTKQTQARNKRLPE